MEGSAGIPVIDVAALASDDLDAIGAVALAIGDACRRNGFFYIEGHGIPEALIARAFAESARFFSLPIDEKLKIKINRANRGYVRPGTSSQKISSVDSPSRANQYESLMIRDELAPGEPQQLPGNPMHGPNQWPQNLPGFKEACLDYYQALLALARRFLPAFALALDLPADHFGRFFQHPTTSLRLLHYPRQESPAASGYGHAPHTDYGFLTILAQDAQSGLEVLDKASRCWIPVPSRAGAFVVNIGDALARWTNRRFASTPHRVASMSAERERYSIPFFFHLDVDAIVDVLPTCCGEDDPPRYPPVRFGDYLAERLTANYASARDNG
ncbi:MAG: isopenicillin N synthase family oxygenase [Burkholderiales bacterium]|nr:isopenicillin N synthase family oxygenase [Burkholderiales bacterium]